MVRSPDRDLAARQNGFAFFGAITASLSHELNNVLATIKELSGLLEDLVHAVKPERGARDLITGKDECPSGEGSTLREATQSLCT